MSLPRLTFNIPYAPAWALLGLLLFSFVIISCSEPDPAFSLNGTWYYAFHENTETGEIESEPEYVARSIIITFDDNGKKGDFYGQTVTNAIQGKYKLDTDGSISFEEITGGLRGEPDWGETFWGALNTAKSYSKETERIEISYDEGKKKLIFIPQEN